MIRLLLALLLLSCSSRKNPAADSYRFSESPPVIDLRIFKVQFDCTYFGLDMISHNYPGRHCVFQDDGSIISGTAESLRKIGPDDSVVWEMKRNIHHQINLSVDKKRILTLSSNIKKIDGLRHRDDVFLILDQNGKILHEQTGQWILKKTGLKPLLWGFDQTNPDTNVADKEYTHFNSIYEIPENSGSNKAPYLKPGNIIINSSILGVFILSPDLKEILYHGHFSESWKNLTHDVQVSKDGTFLLFNNRVRQNDLPTTYSSIDRFDPVKKETVYRLTSEPKEMFFSNVCGGVQEIGDYLFFSHLTTGGFLYSPSEKRMIRTFPPGNLSPIKPTPKQQIKLVDLREFLRARNLEQ